MDGAAYSNSTCFPITPAFSLCFVWKMVEENAVAVLARRAFPFPL